MKIKILGILCMLVVICTFSGCSSVNDTEPVSKTDFYFDTVVTITLYGQDNVKYIDKCFDICSKYEKMFSRTIKGSEIDQINNANGNPVSVSEDTLDLINKGIYYSDKTDGKFDITIGGVSDLWDFDSDKPQVPKESDIASAIENVNYKNIVVDKNNISLSRQGTVIDLGGIAKGYIADKLKEYLISKGINSGVIDLGGNIVLIGSKPDGTAYNIGIKKPFSKKQESAVVVNTKNKSIVSSGNYERYFQKDGKLYNHILDTSTGYPIENNLYSVSIISDKSIDGDGLSTSCYVLGLDKGMQLIEETDGVEAIFIDSDYKLYYSSGLSVKDDVVTLK